MTTIEPYKGTAYFGQTYAPPVSRLGRHVTRHLAQIDAGTSVELGRIDSTSEVQAAKVDAVASVGRKAMQDLALLTEMQTQLVATVPNAAKRLAEIAELASAAMSQIVVDTARRVGR
jgi:hypothetical protein